MIRTKFSGAVYPLRWQHDNIDITSYNIYSFKIYNVGHNTNNAIVFASKKHQLLFFSVKKHRLLFFAVKSSRKKQQCCFFTAKNICFSPQKQQLKFLSPQKTVIAFLSPQKTSIDVFHRKKHQLMFFTAKNSN